MTRPLRVLVFVIVSLVGSVALLVGAEAAYRHRTARHAPLIRYYRHARLQRALVRDTDYDGVVHINRQGFRGPEVDPVKTAGTTRILVVGASTTFDPCARSDSETWTARLEHWLEQLAPGRSFEVINAGVSGFPMLEHVIRLQTETYAFAPDVVVIYAGHGIVSASDAGREADNVSMTPDAIPTITPWDNWLTQHSRLYERVRRSSVATAAPVALTDEQWAVAVDNAARDFSRDLTSFTLIARSLGADVVLTEINSVTGSRTPEEFTPEERAKWQNIFATPPEVVHAGYGRFHEVWRSVADSVGATFIPADSIDITGPENYCSGDPIHFSTAGSETMGRRLAEQLIGSGVLGP